MVYIRTIVLSPDGNIGPQYCLASSVIHLIQRQLRQLNKPVFSSLKWHNMYLHALKLLHLLIIFFFTWRHVIIECNDVNYVHQQLKKNVREPAHTRDTVISIYSSKYIFIYNTVHIVYNTVKDSRQLKSLFDNNNIFFWYLYKKYWITNVRHCFYIAITWNTMNFHVV